LQSLKMAAHPYAAETLNKSEFPLGNNIYGTAPLWQSAFSISSKSA
jgi:hypothetical protein